MVRPTAKSTMSTVGKSPLIINLDDDSNVSECDIELITLDDSHCCQTPSCKPKDEGAKTSLPTVSRSHGEGAVDSQSSKSTTLQTKFPYEDDGTIYSFSSLGMERLRNHMVQAQLAAAAAAAKEREAAVKNARAAVIAAKKAKAAAAADAKERAAAAKKERAAAVKKARAAAIAAKAAAAAANIPGKTFNEKQAGAARQPLKNAKSNKTQKSLNQVAKRKQAVERPSDIELPTLKTSPGTNSNKRGKGSVKSQKLPKQQNCGKAKCGPNKGGAKKTENPSTYKGNAKKKGKKRKSDSADIDHSDEFRFSKSVKLATSLANWQPTAIPCKKPKGNAKARWKKNKEARLRNKNNAGKPATHENSSVQVHILSSTYETLVQTAPNSVVAIVKNNQDAPVQDELGEETAPLGCHRNPIIISDLSFAHENESDFQDDPEIEMLCAVTPMSDSSQQRNSMDIASRKILHVAHVTQTNSESEKPHRFTTNLQEKPANKLDHVSSLPAGPCFGRPNPRIPFTFSLQNSLTSSMTRNMQCSVPTQMPATNVGNFWTNKPIHHSDATVIQWTNLLAEMVESQHRTDACNASHDLPQQNLRPIAIDGSNVAFSHGKDKVFSTKGIQICIDYFLKSGHVVKAFVPQFRRKAGYMVQDHPLLERLGKSQHVVFTPSRDINGVNVASYDDRFVLEYAARTGAVIVSNDNYRDLMKENPLWKEIIDARLLMYTFADDHFMIPDDPLGRHGPRLHQFLRF